MMTVVRAVTAFCSPIFFTKYFPYDNSFLLAYQPGNMANILTQDETYTRLNRPVARRQEQDIRIFIIIFIGKSVYKYIYIY